MMYGSNYDSPGLCPGLYLIIIVPRIWFGVFYIDGSRLISLVCSMSMVVLFWTDRVQYLTRLIPSISSIFKSCANFFCIRCKCACCNYYIFWKCQNVFVAPRLRLSVYFFLFIFIFAHKIDALYILCYICIQ